MTVRIVKVTTVARIVFMMQTPRNSEMIVNHF